MNSNFPFKARRIAGSYKIYHWPLLAVAFELARCLPLFIVMLALITNFHISDHFLNDSPGHK